MKSKNSTNHHDLLIRNGMESLEKAAILATLLFAANLFFTYPERSFNYKQALIVKSAGRVRRGREGGGDDCDIFDGQWVWDENYPLYESKDCNFLDQGFRCSENGRPDTSYAKWRWQPKSCNLSRFDAKDMLEKLRNKRLVFAGDSIGRNQWQSLLCMLSSAVPDKRTIYEINGNPITKHSGFLIFKFKDYNCTVEYYRSPFLVEHGRAPPEAPKDVKMTLKVDLMCFMAYRWKDADVLVFNSGHWWSSDKIVKQGNYFQEGNTVKMEMSMDAAYQRSIKTLLEWIHMEVNMNKTQVYFRTYAPVHFSYEDLKNGGSCHLATKPELNISQSQLNSYSHLLSPLKNLSSKHSHSVHSQEVQAINITYMTALRKDAHPTLYYLGPNVQVPLYKQDCSHWCLPGVPDAWNELLFALILRREHKVEVETEIIDLAPTRSYLQD